MTATTFSVSLISAHTAYEHWARFNLTGHESILVDYDKKRLFRPDTLIIKYAWGGDGPVYVDVRLRGPMVKKDGSDSVRRGSRSYHSKWRDWDTTPDWILDLVREHEPDVRKA